MSQKTITILVILFVILVAGMFSFAYLKKAEIAEQTETKTQTPEPEVAYASVTRIEGKHYFIDGVHTVVGEIALPTPCDLLETNSHVTNSEPERVVLEFTVLNNAEVCAQQVTAQRFKVEAEAAEDATFTAFFMGREVDLNLVPAAPGETPDEFEVFIKG